MHVVCCRLLYLHRRRCFSPPQARGHHCQGRGRRPAAPLSPGKCQVDMGHSAPAHHGSTTQTSIWLREYPQCSNHRWHSSLLSVSITSFLVNAPEQVTLCPLHHIHLCNLMQSKYSSDLTSIFTKLIMIRLHVHSCSGLKYVLICIHTRVTEY